MVVSKSNARLLNQKNISVGHLLEGRDEYGVEKTASGPCYLSALLMVWASFTVLRLFIGGSRDLSP